MHLLVCSCDGMLRSQMRTDCKDDYMLFEASRLPSSFLLLRPRRQRRVSAMGCFRAHSFTVYNPACKWGKILKSVDRFSPSLACKNQKLQQILISTHTHLPKHLTVKTCKLQPTAVSGKTVIFAPLAKCYYLYTLPP